MPRTKEPPRVAVLVGTSTGWGRSIVRGIANYANKHGPWHLWVEGAGQNERLRLPPDWAGDGIIARVADRPTVKLLDEATLPAVNVSGIVLRGADYPRVASDLAAAGRLAAEYLLDRGLRQFGYVGSSATSACPGWVTSAATTGPSRRGLPRPAAVVRCAPPPRSGDAIRNSDRR